MDNFGQSVKGKTDRDDIDGTLIEFLPTFLMWALFDIPLQKIEDDQVMKDINLTYNSIAFALNLNGPTWLRNLKPGHKTEKRQQREALDRLALFISEHSRVLETVPNGKDGLNKDALIEMLHMLFSVAAYRGTQALALNSLAQMPKGYAESAIEGNDPKKLTNAILECARLDTPVTGAHCIVDDDEGLSTEIGGKSFTFPKGTVIFTAMTIANVDKDRFGPNPFVFDPENRDFSKLTSFNSVGESTNPKAPRICPGRKLALSVVDQMIRAKVEAEKESVLGQGCSKVKKQ